jgi:hypothetical protein
MTVELVPLAKAGGAGTNTMDLSKGLDKTKYPVGGEGINQPGGNTGHIDTSPGRDATSAIAHDVLHFAGIKDGYRDGPPDANGNRTATILPGYTSNDIMATRSGTNLPVDQFNEARENFSTQILTGK